MKKLAITTISLALLLNACSGTAIPDPTAEPAAAESTPGTVTAEGRLLPALAVELSFAQGGIIAEVPVKPGDRIAAGEVLAHLVGIETVQAELAAAHLEQITAQQAIETLMRNALLTASQTEEALLAAQKTYDSKANGWIVENKDYATNLELTIDDYVTAEQDYRDARDKLDGLMDKEETNRERRDAREDFDREKINLAEAYTDLVKDVAAWDWFLTDEEADFLKAIGTLEVARENQSRLDEDNLDSEKLAAAEARLEAATAHVAAAEAAIALYEVLAPFDGTVLSTDLKTGETATPGLPVAYLADPTTWTVETKDLAEIDIARVAIGQSATVKLDAFSGEEFTGKVTAIDPVGKEYLGDMTYRVTVSLDEADTRFMWLMTATVSITTTDK